MAAPTGCTSIQLWCASIILPFGVRRICSLTSLYCVEQAAVPDVIKSAARILSRGNTCVGWAAFGHANSFTRAIVCHFHHGLTCCCMLFTTVMGASANKLHMCFMCLEWDICVLCRARPA